MVEMHFTDEAMRTTLECLDLSKRFDISKYFEELCKEGDKVQFCYDVTNDVEYWISLVGKDANRERVYCFTKKTFVHCPVSQDSFKFTREYGKLYFDLLTKISIDVSQKYRKNTVFRGELKAAANKLTKVGETITFHRMQGNAEYAIKLVNGATNEYRVIERPSLEGSKSFEPRWTGIFQLKYETPFSNRRVIKCC